MIGFAVVRKKDGAILRTGSCQNGDLILQAEKGSFATVLEDQNVSELTHYYFEGNFVPKPPESNDELNKEALRLLRTIQQNELSNTDWTQLPDADLTRLSKLKWQEYRAAIRELPKVYSDIIDFIEVVFPVKPQSIKASKTNSKTGFL